MNHPPRMSTEHLTAWRANILDRIEMLRLEPPTLVALIEEVLEARASHQKLEKTGNSHERHG